MRVVIAAYYHPMEMMGGAEYQAWIIAQGMADLGHDVVFLSACSAEEDEFRMGNVTVVKVPGCHIAKQRRHRQLLAEAIQRNDPDICYVRAFEELGTISAVCKDAKVPLVSASCSFLETSPILLAESPIRTLEHLFSRPNLTHLRSFVSIRSSAAHVCITRSLQSSIRRWFPGKSLRVIYVGAPVSPSESIHCESSGQVIWVNNLKRLKRPEAFVELARRLPQFHFVMVGRMAEGRYGRRIGLVLQQAPPNFQYVGSMPIEQVNVMISQSDLLLYTSLPVEGFGNSFIQAWFRGVATVSLSFDPDGIIDREQLGRSPATFEELVADVEDLMQDEVARSEMGRRAREYAISHHSAGRMVASYEALLREVIGGVPETGRRYTCEHPVHLR